MTNSSSGECFTYCYEIDADESFCETKCDIKTKEKSIIEAGKVYNSRLNVVVYCLLTGNIFPHMEQ